MAKLSISKAWDETREVLRRDGKLLTTVALALIVLPGVVQNVVAPPTSPGELPEPGLWLVIALIAFLIGIVGQLAVIRLATGPQTTVGEAISHGARRMPIYLGAMLLIFGVPLLVMFGLARSIQGSNPSGGAAISFLLLFVLFIYLIVRFCLASAVASSEQVGPIGVLQRSWALSRGNWWRLFGFIVLFVIAVLLLMVATGALIGILVSLFFGTPEPMSVGALIIALATQAVVAAVTVVFMVMIARLYLQGAHHGAEASVPSSGT